MVSGVGQKLAMRGLSSDLLERIHKILMECDEFNNSATLRAVFATTELRHYQNELPEPEDGKKSMRVQLTVNFLLNKRLLDGRSVLSLFLSSLYRLKPEGDRLRHQLAELDAEVCQVTSDQLVVPVVIAAMTHEEARALITEAVFNELAAPAELASFQALKLRLQQESVNKLLNHYNENRDAWKPDVRYGETIKDIVEEMAFDLNQERKSYPLIQPYFYSNDFFAEEDDARLEAWDELSWRGCILIVDAFSLFHPVVYRRLLQSEMGANERVAVATAVIFPRISGHHQVTQLMEQEIASRMQRAFVRSKWYEERICRHNVESLDTLRRWVKHNALPEATRIISQQSFKGRPKPKNKRKMQIIEVPGYSSFR